MTSLPHLPHRRRAHRLLAPVLAATLLLAACGGASTDTAGADGTTATDATTATAGGTVDRDATVESDGGTTAVADTTVSTDDLGAVGTLASAEVHDIAVELDTAAFEAMVATYTGTGDKDWIEATVTIDGVTYEQVGLRLKGNSSLRGVTTDDDPATLPWLIKLDKYVDGQAHEGLTELVVRSSSSTTALNEAVALELLDRAGLASQDSIAVRFSVNGGDQVLRLAIDNPDDGWMTEELAASGALYKAESTGDYAYRGDTTTGTMTVVPWDYNLAFGARPGGMEGGAGGPGGAPGGDANFQPPTGTDGNVQPPDGVGRPGGGGDPMGGSNILVERFTADATFNALYQEKLTGLRSQLFDSGVAADILAAYVATVTDSGLVDEATVTTESTAIESYVS